MVAESSIVSLMERATSTMLEMTVTLGAGELKNAHEHEDEHQWFLVLVNWQRFLYITKSI
jgi:hypothetical protein